MVFARGLRTIGLACFVAVFARAPHASADEPGRWSDRLLRGTTPGEPSTAKLATVVSLYSASAVSLAAGIVFTLEGVSTGNEADDLVPRNAPHPCEEKTSDPCHAYREKRRTESDQLLLGKAFLGGSALFVLSGALVAELWPNRNDFRLNAYAASGEAMMGFSASF